MPIIAPVGWLVLGSVRNRSSGCASGGVAEGMCTAFEESILTPLAYLATQWMWAVRRSKMLNRTEQSDRAQNANEKPENCYCSALPKGSGLCLPSYMRWLAGERPRPGNWARRNPSLTLPWPWMRFGHPRLGPRQACPAAHTRRVGSQREALWNDAKDFSGCSLAARWDHRRSIPKSRIRPANDRHTTWSWASSDLSGDRDGIWFRLSRSISASDNCAANIRGCDRGCANLGSRSPREDERFLGRRGGLMPWSWIIVCVGKAFQ